MTVIRELVHHYDRLSSDHKVPEFGFSLEPISFVLELSPKGEVVDVTDIRETSQGKPRPKHLYVPQARISTSNVKPNMFWDKTAYTLGIIKNRTSKKVVPATRGEFEAFKGFHLKILREVEDRGLTAFKNFLIKWNPDCFKDLQHAEELVDSNVVFRLDGEMEYLHDCTVTKAVVHDVLSSNIDAEHGLCLISGENAPIARLHPRIKGVYGSHSAGASIITFNKKSFTSHGKKQGANAPVSELAAFAYTTALNFLLRSRNRMKILLGDTTIVFWARAGDRKGTAEAAEDLFATLIGSTTTDEEESAAIADKLRAVAKGLPLSDVAPNVDQDTRFFVLGLAPNASRLSIRFWHEDTIGNTAQRIVDHWRDLQIEPDPWHFQPSISRLIRETGLQRKMDNVPPTLAGQLMRAILTGGRYPNSLFATIVARMRADKDINGVRVALCKACLARDHRLGYQTEDVPVSLDDRNNNSAYLLGRLFAMYEKLQKAALPSLNATIKDRYFGAASASPASVFPLLEKGSAHHLATLRKSENGGLAYWFDQEIDKIFDQLDTVFPRSLQLQDQGRFAIGYHQQRGSKNPSSDSKTDNETKD